MKINLLILIGLFSCGNMDKQENIEIQTANKQIVKENVIVKSFEKKDIEVLQKDTIVIPLKEINFKILDIRYNDVDKRELKIVKKDSIEHKIKLPTAEDYMGFSVNWIKDIGQGFEISIEFGKFYLSRNFQFNYQNDSFYLTKIETQSIDYENDNKEKKDIKIIEKPIHIDDFLIDDFLE